MSRSALYTANTNIQTVPVDGIIPLGNIVRRFGCAIELNGTGITIDTPGYYDVNVSVTATPTAIGTVTATLLNNGTVVPGATASAAVATVGNPANLSFESIVRVFCNGDTSSLTLVLTGTESSIVNVAVTVTKI